MVNLGDKAPNANLRLTNSSGEYKQVDLEQLFHDQKVILYFFPAAFTGVCTTSSCQMRDDLQEFTEYNAKIYGVSTDGPFVHQEFIKKNNLNFSMLSDWHQEAIDAYSIRDDDFAGGLRGIARRSLFLIANGEIKYKWVADTPGDYPPFDALKIKLRST